MLPMIVSSEADEDPFLGADTTVLSLSSSYSLLYTTVFFDFEVSFLEAFFSFGAAIKPKRLPQIPPIS